MFQYTEAGCDNSRFLVVPDWYSNNYCRVLDTNVRLKVYLVVKIKGSFKKVIVYG